MSEIFKDHDFTVKPSDDRIAIHFADYYWELHYDQATTMCNAILAHINEQNALRAAEVAKQRYEDGL